MTRSTPILCIGSVLWDVVGRSDLAMRQGSDVPGRITRVPGGVAMNIAMALARIGRTPELLSALGKDAEGRELINAAQQRGIGTQHLYISDDLPTDSYMAVEGANGLIAAIADAHSLEAAGEKILRPLEDGRLGSAQTPFGGTIILDGNLTTQLLRDIAHSVLFSRADLRIAPASPGKAERLLPMLSHPTATFYVNLEEANLITHHAHANSAAAAQAMIAQGAARVLVTHGARDASFADHHGCITQTPPEVLVARVTGAGDNFMAAHVAAELDGAAPAAALTHALNAAALYVSGDTAL